MVTLELASSTAESQGDSADALRAGIPRRIRQSVSSDAARLAALAQNSLEQFQSSQQELQEANAVLRAGLVDLTARISQVSETFSATIQDQAKIISSLTKGLTTTQAELAAVRGELSTLKDQWDGHTHSIRLPAKYWAVDAISTGPLGQRGQNPTHY